MMPIFGVLGQVVEEEPRIRRGERNLGGRVVDRDCVLHPLVPSL